MVRYGNYAVMKRRRRGGDSSWHWYFIGTEIGKQVIFWILKMSGSALAQILARKLLCLLELGFYQFDLEDRSCAPYGCLVPAPKTSTTSASIVIYCNLDTGTTSSSCGSRQKLLLFSSNCVSWLLLLLFYARRRKTWPDCMQPGIGTE